ncbi:MAG: CcmD family protein [Cytophagaceae bacterium]
MKKLIALCLFFVSFSALALNADTTKTTTQTQIQKTSEVKTPATVEMADSFRSEGKIYILLAVVLVVLLGIFAYLFLLEKKMADIEKQLDPKYRKIRL